MEMDVLDVEGGHVFHWAEEQIVLLLEQCKDYVCEMGEASNCLGALMHLSPSVTLGGGVGIRASLGARFSHTHRRGVSPLERTML